MIEVNIYEKKWLTSLKAPVTLIEQIVACIPEASEKKISFLLSNDYKIQELNKKYRKKDKPTNVLSFPYEDFPDGTIGDIILSLETITLEAKEANITFQEHVAHMIIHGTLHLLGYSHDEEHDAEIMESLEARILSNVKEKVLFPN